MTSDSRITSDRVSDTHEFKFTLADFRQICRLIYERAGIRLSDTKTSMVYSRLSRRLRALGLASFAEYLQLLEQGNEAEWTIFVGSLTTHLTSFYRESHHFPIMVEHVAARARGGKALLWSCATSTGEEPYTMAIAVAEHFESFHPPVRILATDVDTGVLEMASEGVYPFDRVRDLPEKTVKKYFLKGSGEHTGFVRIRPELQQMIRFQQLNLLSPVWPMKEQYDAIFCRNVMIYFDRPTQQKVLNKCLRHLKPDGLFFTGHSENLNYAADLFQSCGNTVYRPRVTEAQSVRGTQCFRECSA
ncbi:MCP methyltransferase, CheR-type [Trichlorobacter thiogenes]|uniref:protein-glutamate O-methyltransferase n=1 Tax=Trichlorobacter thiogenes TaxID=115783 RepID=A0A1T4L647_9BACT|nr:CheR family methyltransferase [Trichlorobacter thiogenes]SJZ50195.1 MCP methyltransferase, CheR-type [Trichlorobacter thiogenes]